MKMLGLIGGMSWESTAVYYRLMNEEVKSRLGGFHSAEILLASMDFAPLEAWQRSGDWDAAGEALADCALTLEGAGAQAIMLCTNTMHRVASTIEAAIGVPLLHIADAAAAPIIDDGNRQVLLLGTRYTMEQPFLRERLERGGLNLLIPSHAERECVNRVIYDELCQGRVIEASRAAFLEIIEGHAANAGVQAVLLACTEIGMLVEPRDVSIPVYDSTVLHAQFGMKFAFENGPEG